MPCSSPGGEHWNTIRFWGQITNSVLYRLRLRCLEAVQLSVSEWELDILFASSEERFDLESLRV